jgi:hypothetical protein
MKSPTPSVSLISEPDLLGIVPFLSSQLDEDVAGVELAVASRRLPPFDADALGGDEDRPTRVLEALDLDLAGQLSRTRSSLLLATRRTKSSWWARRKFAGR